MEKTEHEIVCWIAEYSYCKANGFPMNEGHTPPSMVYEQVERNFKDFLASQL